MGGNDAIYDGGRKRSADASVVKTTPKMRAPPDYKEKDSNEFKIFASVYTAGHYNYEMEVANFDYLSQSLVPKHHHMAVFPLTMSLIIAATRGLRDVIKS
jgi:hypothetical protein